MKLYIWMRPGLIRIMPLTTCLLPVDGSDASKIPSERKERTHLSKLVRKSAYASIKKPKCYRFQD